MMLTDGLRTCDKDDPRRQQIRELATSHAADFMRQHSGSIRDNMTRSSDPTLVREQIRSLLRAFLAKKLPDIKTPETAKIDPPTREPISPPQTEHPDTMTTTMGSDGTSEPAPTATPQNSIDTLDQELIESRHDIPS
jgi:hypothetical protein